MREEHSQKNDGKNIKSSKTVIKKTNRHKDSLNRMNQQSRGCDAGETPRSFYFRTQQRSRGTHCHEVLQKLATRGRHLRPGVGSVLDQLQDAKGTKLLALFPSSNAAKSTKTRTFLHRRAWFAWMGHTHYVHFAYTFPTVKCFSRPPRIRKNLLCP